MVKTGTMIDRKAFDAETENERKNINNKIAQMLKYCISMEPVDAGVNTLVYFY
jgi:hypothetical protein